MAYGTFAYGSRPYGSVVGTKSIKIDKFITILTTKKNYATLNTDFKFSILNTKKIDKTILTKVNQLITILGTKKDNTVELITDFDFNILSTKKIDKIILTKLNKLMTTLATTKNNTKLNTKLNINTLSTKNINHITL